MHLHVLKRISNRLTEKNERIKMMSLIGKRSLVTACIFLKMYKSRLYQTNNHFKLKRDLQNLILEAKLFFSSIYNYSRLTVIYIEGETLLLLS